MVMLFQGEFQSHFATGQYLPMGIRGVARISKKGGQFFQLTSELGCAYQPFTSDCIQSLASETTRKKYYCSSGSIVFKFVNILFKSIYIVINLSNLYDYLWHLH